MVPGVIVMEFASSDIDSGSDSLFDSIHWIVGEIFLWVHIVFVMYIADFIILKNRLMVYRMPPLVMEILIIILCKISIYVVMAEDIRAKINDSILNPDIAIYMIDDANIILSFAAMLFRMRLSV